MLVDQHRIAVRVDHHDRRQYVDAEIEAHLVLGIDEDRVGVGPIGDELATGATVSGNVCLPTPSDDVDSLVLFSEADFGGDKVFFSLDGAPVDDATLVFADDLIAAARVMQLTADRAGLVLQPSNSKKAANICCCCGCCCPSGRRPV